MGERKQSVFAVMTLTRLMWEGKGSVNEVFSQSVLPASRSFFAKTAEVRAIGCRGEHHRTRMIERCPPSAMKEKAGEERREEKRIGDKSGSGTISLQIWRKR